ncbi:hypothetical protein LTR47_011185 [Exophiala xenobiotica]|nr:hypothetical protein LTR72_011242 [Exophiala xenobiotica]KAK5220382.1 hypothetical protein LTR47_011185 [Exophiala xenobiotica]KAK5253991.1 hypothetical protein LTS06_001797 [Exophiala xenobiotica]KAK5330462.1 hypothetical protein LTR93_002051 [Exophiala xenobiotica]KAK5353575.1 hypothetical protein LTR61_003533 [Exophiala xenobiotica]
MGPNPPRGEEETNDEAAQARLRRTSVYDTTTGTLEHEQDGLSTETRIGDDGRVDINVTRTSTKLAHQLEQIHLDLNRIQEQEEPSEPPPPFVDEATGRPFRPPPPLNIVIQVVGSRGDVQPFVALGQVLRTQYGHRVRLATHGTFKKFVEENGLEFFDIGGDPAELMAFMVKNPGLIPGIKSLRAGDVGRRQKGMAEILEGCWRSCADSDEVQEDADSNSQRPRRRPFVANAIIANPPSFAHIHCAQKLGIPLHLMFTMPWSPTREFPQPIANIHSSNKATGQITNEMSYTLVDMMTWEGLGDITNNFRKHTLGLGLLSQAAAVDLLYRLRIPYTYCWSPALIPKPRDWGPHITISGFYFLSLATNYQPDHDLADFLASGPPPVYIGFGSIVVDDPNAMTKLIFDAVKKTGQRALVSKGWGGLGGEDLGKPEGVFMLGNCPHDWLFQRVSCVVHHGGAGTTAAGIALGRPTVIVPFFGDQPFWGAMVARAGAGPTPIPSKELTADRLADAILDALKPATLERARELGDRIKEEKGCEVGAASFHQQMDVDRLRCTVAPHRPAVWWVKTKGQGQGQPGPGVRLSAFAATVLNNEGLLDVNQLRLYRPCEYPLEEGQFTWDRGPNPVLSTAGSYASAILHIPVNIAKAWGGIVYEPYKGARKGGWKGFGKGLGRGIGHFLVRQRGITINGKTYGMRVIYDSLKKQFGDDTLSFILAVHFAQGYEEVKASTEEERQDVLNQWHRLDLALQVVSTQSSRSVAPDVASLTKASSRYS